MLEFLVKSLNNELNMIFMFLMIGLCLYYFFLMLKYGTTKEELNKFLLEIKEMEENGVVNKVNSKNYYIMNKEIDAFNNSLLLKEEKYFSTVNIEKYFNSITLLEEKLNIKLITNIPSIFPGIGILGTFIGLAYGLSSVNASGSSDEILGSIKPLLENISVAFITSIFGIFFSLITTFILNYFLGNSEKKILELTDTLNRIYPLYTKILQGEELLNTIKDIKTTTNGLASDISNQLGEHISTQVGNKIDTLVSGSHEVMKGLTENIGNKIEFLTETLSTDFGESLTESLNKIFTEELIGNFKKLGEDAVKISTENIRILEEFTLTMEETIFELNGVKNNFTDINQKTNDTNKEIEASLTNLTESISERVAVVDKTLEKTAVVFSNTGEEIKTLEASLRTSLENSVKTMEQFNNYMEINKAIRDSMNNFNSSDDKILEVWEKYDNHFTKLNTLLTEGANSFEGVLGRTTENLKTTMSEISTNLIDVKDNYIEINDKTSETSKEVKSSMIELTDTMSKNITTIGKTLEKSSDVLELSSEQILELETSLSTSLENSVKTMEQFNNYMEINKAIRDSMNNFNSSDDKILEVWEKYDNHFTKLNTLLTEGANSFEGVLGRTTENLKTTMSEISTNLIDVKDNYIEINDKTSETSKEVKSSMIELTDTMSKNITIIGKTLEKSSDVLELSSEQILELETSLSTSLNETSKAMEKINNYMKSNQNISEAIDKLVKSEEKVLTLWSDYDKTFSNLNKTLSQESNNYKEALSESVKNYSTQLAQFKNEFSNMMKSLNQKYVDYTNKNTLNLFQDYDHNLSTAISKFNGLMSNLGEEIEELQDLIGSQNEKIEKIIEKNQESYKD